MKEVFVFLFIFIWIFSGWQSIPPGIKKAQAAAQGDGVIFYGLSGNTTSQVRDYNGTLNSFSAESGTVVGTQPVIVKIRTSPIKDEYITAYQDTSGNLQVMCYNGASWSNEWSIAVAPSGTPTTRRFDIAYETNSGDVVVVYSRNIAATNALAYRTKLGTSGCGTANWSVAANFPTATSVTTGTVQWVKVARDERASSNLDAFIWADSNQDLGGAIWDGSVFTNFKVLETTLERITTAQDVDSFELAYESISGNLMVVWGSGGTNGTNGAYYNRCVGGTSACTWTAARTAFPSLLDDATVLDLAANPLSNQMSFSSIGNAGADLQAAYWNGSAWTGYPNLDTSCEAPAAGRRLTQTGWLVNGGTTKWVLTYDDANGTGLSWYATTPGSAQVKQTDWAATPAINDIRSRYDIDNNPFDASQFMLTLSDSTNAIFAKRLVMNIAGAFTWSNADGGASLGTKYSHPQQGFHFQYRRFIPPPILTQNYFRFYVDNNSLIPTDPWPLGAVDLGENAEITSDNSPPIVNSLVRIRMSIQVFDSALPASSQAFKLQYGQRITTCGAIASWNDLGNPGSASIWRGYNGTPADGINLSGNPPTAGDLKLSVSDRAGTYEEQNDTPVNPYQVSTGEDVEYDWLIQNNGANSSTAYCFRMVKSDNNPLNNYNFYPALTTAGYNPKAQNWRWYDDENNETPAAAMAGENVSPSNNIVNGNIIKLRLTINEVNGLAGTNIKFKIQFSEFSDFSQGVSDAVEIGSCVANSLWCYGNGVDNDDDVIVTRLLSDSTANGRHNESGASASTYDPPASTPVEFEFTLKHAGARANVTYFFRAYDVINNNAVTLNTGETNPSLSTEGAGLTFTVDGLSSGTVTEGIITDVGTTPTAVSFGNLAFDTETEAAQRLTVATNATEGYQLFLFQRQGFLRTGGSEIPPVAGTNAVPSSWTVGCSSSAKGCYGYHAGDDTLEGGSARFAANDTYAQLESSPKEISFSSIPVASESNDVVYKVKVTNKQEAGSYESSIVYIVVPAF